MLDNPAASSIAAVGAASQSASAAIHVWLFGGLSKFAAERPLVLNLPSGFCAYDVIAELAKRCGPDFLGAVMDDAGRLPSCCRIFLDGWPVDDINRPLKIESDTADWEMIVLTGEPGG